MSHVLTLQVWGWNIVFLLVVLFDNYLLDQPKLFYSLFFFYLFIFTFIFFLFYFILFIYLFFFCLFFIPPSRKQLFKKSPVSLRIKILWPKWDTLSRGGDREVWGTILSKMLCLSSEKRVYYKRKESVPHGSKFFPSKIRRKANVKFEASVFKSLNSFGAKFQTTFVVCFFI